jgi:hypothetical protein
MDVWSKDPKSTTVDKLRERRTQHKCLTGLTRLWMSKYWIALRSSTIVSPDGGHGRVITRGRRATLTQCAWHWIHFDCC